MLWESASALKSHPHEAVPATHPLGQASRGNHHSARLHLKRNRLLFFGDCDKLAAWWWVPLPVHRYPAPSHPIYPSPLPTRGSRPANRRSESFGRPRVKPVIKYGAEASSGNGVMLGGSGLVLRSSSTVISKQKVGIISTRIKKFDKCVAEQPSRREVHLSCEK